MKAANRASLLKSQKRGRDRTLTPWSELYLRAYKELPDNRALSEEEFKKLGEKLWGELVDNLKAYDQPSTEPEKYLMHIFYFALQDLCMRSRTALLTPEQKQAYRYACVDLNMTTCSGKTIKEYPKIVAFMRDPSKASKWFEFYEDNEMYCLNSKCGESIQAGNEGNCLDADESRLSL